jgi:hypothetical protein
MVETIVLKTLLHTIALILNFRMEWKSKMKTVRTIPKSLWQIVGDKIDTPLKHDSTCIWYRHFNQKWRDEICPLCKFVGSCQYFRYLNLITTVTYNLVSSIVVANAVNIIYSLHLSCQMHNTGIPEFTPGV